MLSSQFTCKIREFAAAGAMFVRDERVLVAASGGADSTALLLALHELADTLRIRLAMAHLHHGIRGKEADGDAAFVRTLARRLHIPLIEGRADVPALARRKKISLEMAAREARYKFLVRAARQAGASVVATAHSADDQVETVLLRLARGAGLRGLAGIPSSTVLHGLRLVRPMLTVSRPEIIAYLEARGAEWREDSTNREVLHLRNRVRHKVLPLLEQELNPDIRAAIQRTALLLRDDEAWLDSMARSLYADVRVSGTLPGLDVRLLRTVPAAACRRTILLWLTEIGVPSERLEFSLVERVHALILGAGPRSKIEIPGGRSVLLRQDRLLTRAAAGPGKATGMRARRILIPGETLLNEAGLWVRTRLAPGIVKDRNRKAGALPAAASLALAALRGRVMTVRSWQPGDRMRPLGMRGSRKLQDIWTDAKIPREERGAIPVFVCGGEIVWIPGYRVAHGWEVRDAHKPALQLEIGKQKALASPRVSA